MKQALSEAEDLQEYLRSVAEIKPAVDVQEQLTWLATAIVILRQFVAQNQTANDSGTTEALKTFQKESKSVRAHSPRDFVHFEDDMLSGAIEALHAAITMAGDSDIPPPPKKPKNSPRSFSAS